MKKHYVVTLVICIVIGAVLLATVYNSAGHSRPVVGNKIESIAMVDAKNQPQEFAQLHGSDVLVYFWASWCIPCYDSIKIIELLRDTNPSTTPIVLVALDDDISKAAKVLVDLRYSGRRWFAKDGTQIIAKGLFGNRTNTLPHFVQLDKQLNITYAGRAPNSKTQWKKALGAD